jgi:hypothetical protein
MQRECSTVGACVLVVSSTPAESDLKAYRVDGEGLLPAC